MADNHSKEARSMNMSHIRSTNSKPEEIVRKYLFAEGFRYRKNVKKLPGCPDIGPRPIRITGDPKFLEMLNGTIKTAKN